MGDRDGGSPRRSRNRRAVLAATGGMAAAVGGCLGTPRNGGPTAETDDDGDRPSGERRYIWGSSSQASTLHPYGIGDEATDERISLLYDAGYGIDDDRIASGERPPIDPFWFASWELSDDARTVTYTLRDGLRFGGDHGALTADTYLANIRRGFAADPNWTNFRYNDRFSIGGERITFEKLDRLRFRAELPQPRASWVHTDPVSYVVPVPVAFLDAYGPQENPEPDRKGFMEDERLVEAGLTGTLGPFQLDTWDRGSKMVLRANEDWYYRDVSDEPVPKLGTITVQLFDEQTTAYAALKAGEITTTSVEARKAAAIGDARGVKLWHSEFGSGIFWLNLNHRINGWAPIRESRDVRQAFGHLFDKGTLIDQIFDGNANPVDTFTPRWGPYYDDSLDYFVPEPSVERAKRKFERGTSTDYGYTEDGTFVGPDGEQVDLTLVIRAGSQSNEIVANFMEQQLAKAGIATTVESKEWSNLLDAYFETRVAYNPNYSGDPDWGPVGDNGGPWNQATSKEPWDLAYGLGFSHGAYAPWTVLSLTMAERGSFNMWGYTTDEYDFASVSNRAASATTREEAKEILAPVFAFLSHDQPLVWAFNDHSIGGYREPVAGLPEVLNSFTEPDVKRRVRLT